MYSAETTTSSPSYNSYVPQQAPPPQQFYSPSQQFEQSWFIPSPLDSQQAASEPGLGEQLPAMTSMRRTESAGAFVNVAPGFDPSSLDDEDDIPLLEELGISFRDIWYKTKLVLRPMSDMDEHVVDDADLAGPIVFGLCLGAMLLLRGKVHFGYIYGWGVCSCLLTYAILSLMAPPESDLTFSHVVSFLGYCLLPVICLAALAVVVNLTNGPVGTSLAALCVIACTSPCTRLFEAKLKARHQRFIIAYPLALIYSCFVLITIF